MTAQTKATSMAYFFASSELYLSMNTHRKKKNIAMPKSADEKSGEIKTGSEMHSLHFSLYFCLQNMFGKRESGF